MCPTKTIVIIEAKKILQKLENIIKYILNAEKESQFV